MRKITDLNDVSCNYSLYFSFLLITIHLHLIRTARQLKYIVLIHKFTLVTLQINININSNIGSEVFF